MCGTTQTRSFHSILSPSTPKAGSNIISSTVGENRGLTSELASIIQETNDAERLEELLNVNLLKEVPGRGSQS